MRDKQREIIGALGVQPSIDPAAEIKARIGFLKSYLAGSGAHGAVLGISGGQDSSLAGRLTQLATEELTASGHPCEFLGVRLPYGRQLDEDDASLACEFIAPTTLMTFNIVSTVDALAGEFAAECGTALTDFNKGNVKARARMITQYAIAGQFNYRVIGTDHAAEAVTGFYTKYGDGAADLTPLAGLTKRQGRALLAELGAPDRLYLKTPTADLLDDEPGQTDEANLGLSYDDIDTYLEGGDVDPDVARTIESKYAASEHKRRMPAAPYDTWWR